MSYKQTDISIKLGVRILAIHSEHSSPIWRPIPNGRRRQRLPLALIRNFRATK